jgi:uncharacterized protein
MLIRFIVSNFLSFDKETEFNMLPGPFKSHKHHVYEAGKVNVLKAGAIYGANGAGKSNLVKSLEFLQNMVESGAVTKSVNNRKFKLNKSNQHKPATFEIEFSTSGKIFSYGISIDHTSVKEEWLYESGINADDKLIFERKLLESGNSTIKMAKKYITTKKAALLIELMEDNLLKRNELLLGKYSTLQIPDIGMARQWFKWHLKIIYPRSRFFGLILNLTASQSFNTFANKILNTFDTGVASLDVETLDADQYFGDDEARKKEMIDQLEQGRNMVLPTDSGSALLIKENGEYIIKKVVSKHNDENGNPVVFNLDEESDGTQRLLDFIPAFEMILSKEITFVIDEIDQSLHPVLLHTLVQKIMNDESTKGQLIFTTHESNLLNLDYFRQDEIWFAEKNQAGSTELYSLSEFKPRTDLDIRKGYLKGRFGAIPFLASLEDLNWKAYAEEKEGV